MAYSPSIGSTSHQCTYLAHVGQYNCHCVYQQNGGTHSMVCNDIAQNVWQWVTSRNIWLSAVYVPGSENQVADFKSHHFEDNTEWSLSPILFQKLSQQFCIPRVDLFASRLNHQGLPLSLGNLNQRHGWLMPFLLIGRILCFMHSLHLVSWVEYSPKSKRNKLRAYWCCHCGLLSHGSLGSSPSAYPTRLSESADQGKSTTPAPPSQKVGSFSDSFSDSFVRSTLTDSGLLAGSTELLSHAWREGTKLQYDTTVRRWGEYCRKWKIDTFTPL